MTYRLVTLHALQTDDRQTDDISHSRLDLMVGQKLHQYFWRRTGKETFQRDNLFEDGQQLHASMRCHFLPWNQSISDWLRVPYLDQRRGWRQRGKVRCQSESYRRSLDWTPHKALQRRHRSDYSMTTKPTAQFERRSPTTRLNTDRQKRQTMHMRQSVA